MKEEIFNIALAKDVIIGFSALIGMILEIYNLVRSIKKDKVSLKIIPKTVVRETRNTETGRKGFILADNTFSNTHTLFAFEIINKSNFPVIVDEIGFTIRSKKIGLQYPYLNLVIKESGLESFHQENLLWYMVS